MALVTRASKKNTEASSPAAGLNLSAAVIDRKFDEIKLFIKQEIKQFDERVMQCLSSLKAEIANVRTEVNTLTSKYKTVTKRCEDIAFDVEKLSVTVSNFENNLISSDVVVMNIPAQADAVVAVNKFIEVLDCGPLEMQKIFRTHNNKNSTESIPIIAKLKSPDDRANLFRAISQFKKKNKRQIKLSDIGVAGVSDIVVHECLTTYNRQLLRNALHFKRNKLINAAFTLRGHVYVRMQLNGRAVKIPDVKMLNDVVGGTGFERINN